MQKIQKKYENRKEKKKKEKKQRERVLDRAAQPDPISTAQQTIPNHFPSLSNGWSPPDSFIVSDGFPLSRW
jgi:hypothetical protein